MKNKFSKSETEKLIREFFKNIKSKSPKEVKKIKRSAMSKNIALKENRKLFCKKCLVPYDNPKVRIKNKRKTVVCKKCDYIARWKV